MAKLYPPNIEGTIPAFSSTRVAIEEGVTNQVYQRQLVVPFSMNRAVGKLDISGFVLKIKSVQGGSHLGTYYTTSYDADNMMEAYFVLDEVVNEKPAETKERQGKMFEPIVGQFYKLQLAYLDLEGNEGYFSTVGVVKCITKPIVYLDGMKNVANSNGAINTHTYKYIGVYSQEGGDVTEKAYSYRFIVKDSRGKIIADSGDCLHDSSQDVLRYESRDEFVLAKDLDMNQAYYMTYSVKTINGYVATTNPYKIMQKKSVAPEIGATLHADLDYENGYVNITLKGRISEVTGLEEPEVGAYLISRSSSEDGYVWNEILRFNLQSELPSRWLWRDHTVKQGVTYVYAIQQYNDEGLYSDRIITKSVYVDFEDAFLFDGERQLKIKYNPKISTFKKDILEAKMETIGSKHPFIFRNGNVNYREFPISGLISYLSDEQNLFISKGDIGISEKSTELISENIAAERNFKMEALEWLTNGKPKIFRSPTEGNFIVRLMNTSLSPTDAVGRMLHTFNTTAYEVADFTYDKLTEYGFIQTQSPSTVQYRWETIEFIQRDNKGGVKYLSGVINKRTAYSVFFSDMIPGSIIYVTELLPNNSQKRHSIMIGATGSYSFDTGIPIIKIEIPKDAKYQGSVTYSYQSRAVNTFDMIKTVDIMEYPARQFIGRHADVVDLIEDSKISIIEFFNLHFKKRPVEYIYIKNDGNRLKYYKDRHCTPGMELDIDDEANAYYLFEVRECRIDSTYDYGIGEGYWVDAEGEKHWPAAGQYLDGYTKTFFNADQYSNTFEVNGDKVDLTITNDYVMENMTNIKTITLGSGVALDAAYQVRVITYSLEYTDDTVVARKEDYEKALEEWSKLKDKWNEGINPPTSAEVTTRANQEMNALNSIKVTYTNFINALDDAIEEYKEANMI